MNIILCFCHEKINYWGKKKINHISLNIMQLHQIVQMYLIKCVNNQHFIRIKYTF